MCATPKNTNMTHVGYDFDKVRQSNGESHVQDTVDSLCVFNVMYDGFLTPENIARSATSNKHANVPWAGITNDFCYILIWTMRKKWEKKVFFKQMGT